MPLLATLLLMAVLESPSITPFAHGKPAAFSMEFDDSMTTHVKNLLPLLAQYKFTATFYINPGEQRYQVNKDVWDKQVPAAGHELGNHTMHHKDTVGAAQAASEIGDAAKAIEKILGRPTLTPFAVPGGVKWDIPSEDFQRILRENRLIYPKREDFYQDGHGDITRLANLALDTNSWHHLGFHGVGGEWLSTSVENMTTLLKFLDKNRDKIWVAPTGTVFKYMRERDALSGIEVKKDGTIVPTFDKEKLDPFELYNVPLTMRVPVAAGWTKATVTIDGRRPTSIPVKNGAIQFEFTPQAKSIKVTRG